MKNISRKEARKKAFELIFSLNQQDEDLNEAFVLLLEETPEALNQMPYIRNVVCGVREREAELENLISAHLSKGWSLHRLSKVSLAILKLAAFEIQYVEDVPDRVAINEAVELSKQYGAEDEPAFVNGVLGGIVRAL